MRAKAIYEAYLEDTGSMQGHLRRIHDLVIDTDAQQVIELGVNKGESTSAFLVALAETGGRLWSCDLRTPRLPIAEVEGLPYWSFARGDDRALLDRAPDGADILFIDTSHTYEHTAWELENYGPKVRDGGYILLHDTELPGVMRAIREYLKGRGWHFENHPKYHGLGVIRVRP